VNSSIDKRIFSLERVVKMQTMRRFRSLDFSAITNDELDYLAWIAEHVGEHGPAWIETALSDTDRVDLDAMLARIVILEE
jgi:hypothetical protein